MLFFSTFALFVSLIALSVYDVRHFRLPDVVTLPLIALGLLLAASNDVSSLPWHASGAAIGFLSFWVVSAAYIRLNGRIGLGLGDAKLLAASGAWLGPLALPAVVLFSSTAALLVAGLTVFRSGASAVASPIAFGPYLCIAFAVCWMLRLLGVLPF